MLDQHTYRPNGNTHSGVNERYKSIIELIDATENKEEREAILKPIVNAQFSSHSLRYLTHMMYGDFQTVPHHEYESGTLGRIKFLALNATVLLHCKGFNNKYSNHDIIREHLSWNMNRPEIGSINQARSNSILNIFNIMVFLARKGYDYNKIVTLYNPEIIIEEADEKVDKLIANRNRIFCMFSKCSYILLLAVGSLTPGFSAYALGSPKLVSLGVGASSFGLLLASTCLYSICKNYNKTCKFPCPDYVDNFVDMLQRNYVDLQETIAVRFA